MCDRVRRVMNLVHKDAQEKSLLPRTEDTNPVKRVHSQTTSDYEAILVEPALAWPIICHMKAFEESLTALLLATGLGIGEVRAGC